MKIRSILLLLLLTLGSSRAGAQSFTFVEALFDGDAQAATSVDGLEFVFATAVSPDGTNVYACSGNNNIGPDDNAVAVFSRDADGSLSFVEAVFDAGDAGNPGPADALSACRDVAVSPDGKHVYTAGFSDNAVGIFDRDPATGELTFDSSVKDGVGLDGLAGVEAITLSADGAFLFAVGSLDDALVVLARDAATGALTFEDSATEGLGGVTGLDRPVAVAVSPDGRHVYTAAGSSQNFSGSDAVALFDWDAGTGDLTFVTAYFEGSVQGPSTIDGLGRVSSVTVSPDGAHVYATASPDPLGDRDWITVFSRSGTTGELTWLEEIDDFNFCSLDVLFGFETYAVVHPGNERVFVTSARAALVELSRDTVTGALSFADAECFFDDLSLGINLPAKLAQDTTGTHLYVPGNASDAVAVFDSGGIFTDGFESGGVADWSSSYP